MVIETLNDQRIGQTYGGFVMVSKTSRKSKRAHVRLWAIKKPRAAQNRAARG
jgi:hypothetical protein